MPKNRKHDSKKLEDHVVDKTRFVELNAADAPTTNVPWDVHKAEVHSDPVFDPGTGQKVLARRFRFQLPPGLKETPSHEELRDYHVKNTVIPMLYRDELELLDEPRIVSGKKGSYTIVALCAPRLVLGVRSTIHEQADNVTEIINASRDNSK